MIKRGKNDFIQALMWEASNVITQLEFLRGKRNAVRGAEPDRALIWAVERLRNRDIQAYKYLFRKVHLPLIPSMYKSVNKGTLVPIEMSGAQGKPIMGIVVASIGCQWAGWDS